jgi:EAL domain-containing protein (putative c-di-GMP-specific phosphodiesterase class I)
MAADMSQAERGSREVTEQTPPARCPSCAGRGKQSFTAAFTMAFQPIYDLEAGAIFAHEALLRTPAGGGPGEIFAQVTAENRYAFDQACRVRAIELAARLGMTERLSINFMPNAVYNPDHCIQTTLWAADKHDFPIENIIFEFTEGEEVTDKAHLSRIVASYKARGFRTAIDDFGAGYSGLNLLADVQPDIVKIDMGLIQGMDADPVRRKIVGAMAALARDLGITVVAEGVETAGEMAALVDCGVTLLQGYALARPMFEGLVPAAEIARAIAPLRRAS